MFKVGDLIEALPESDYVYGKTNHRGACVGKVLRILSDKHITIQITSHKDCWFIGDIHDVDAEYFTYHHSHYLKTFINSLTKR